MGLDPHAAGIADGWHSDPADELTGSHGPAAAPPGMPTPVPPQQWSWRRRIVTSMVVALAILGGANWLIADTVKSDGGTTMYPDLSIGPSFAQYLTEAGLDPARPQISVGPEEILVAGQVTGSSSSTLGFGSGTLNGEFRPGTYRTLAITVGTLSYSTPLNTQNRIVVNAAISSPRIILVPEEGVDAPDAVVKSAPRYDRRVSTRTCEFHYWWFLHDRQCGYSQLPPFDAYRLAVIRNDPLAELAKRFVRIEVPPSALPSAQR